jgi:hypothetical protein
MSLTYLSGVCEVGQLGKVRKLGTCTRRIVSFFSRDAIARICRESTAKDEQHEQQHEQQQQQQQQQHSSSTCRSQARARLREDIT